jgi:hypothetical protein
MTNTLRVDITYRPLRIGWAVRQGDMDAIRRAVRYSHVLWGGRFNPILIVDRIEEASQIVELFRVDMIWPLGEGEDFVNFARRFGHLIKPFVGDSIFERAAGRNGFARVLDISNALAHWRSKPEWIPNFIEKFPRAHRWEDNDPLADVFLMQLGAYPDDVGVDYTGMVEETVKPRLNQLGVQARIPADVLNYPNLGSIGRLGIGRNYSVMPGWDTPGFFVGSANEPDDLVCFWNCRACDIPLWFVDPAHRDRYVDALPGVEQVLRRMVDPRRPALGLWSRHQLGDVGHLFDGMQLSVHIARDGLWAGGAVRPPMMQLGQVSTLGVMGESEGVPRVNFALAEKPFQSSASFGQQHLVASISFIGGLYGDDRHTLEIPYLPELNEFYARTMHFRYDKLRVEPGRVGLIIDADEHDTFLNAMPVADLIGQIFSLAGFSCKPSAGGRIVRQLLTQVGGVQGARVFKIPGVRRLLREFGPQDTFLRETAKNLIVDKTSEHEHGTFSAHADLVLVSRSPGTSLSPLDAFDFMVDKGLFRMGVDLHCPSCDLSSWVSLDKLKQQTTCELCGNYYDATRQLIVSKWRYRRSGILGAERNSQGAVPVALTLQQLDANLHLVLNRAVYSPSLELTPIAGAAHAPCEIDLVWLECDSYPMEEGTTVVLAECKDRGPIGREDFRRDIENLRRVADSFSHHRIRVYLLIVKLAPFTADEVAIARTLNPPQGQQRVILLTANELEPYHFFDRLDDHHRRNLFCGSPADLARATEQIYFTDPLVGGAGIT